MIMFTLESIYGAFEKVKTDKDFASFFSDLKELGVVYYDNYVEDGHTEYFDADGNSVKSDAKYSTLEIGSENAMNFTEAIEKQRLGEMDFDTFCKAAANNGVNMWKTDLENMNVIYLSCSGEPILQEPISLV